MLTTPFRRRPFFHLVKAAAIVCLLLVLGLTAACSSESRGPEPEAPKEPQSNAAAPQTGAQTPANAGNVQRTVKHLSGETTIIGTPQKIAVLDYRLADTLVALGITPHAMTTYLGDVNLPYLDGKPLSKAIPLGDTANLEAVLQAGPDLIIARKSEEKVYEQLSKIAPTVIVDAPSDWRQSLKEIAAILQREKEAEQWLANYDSKAASVRNELAKYVKPGETFLYLRVMPKEIRVHGTKELFGATMFQDLKLTPVPGLESVDRVEAISLEKLPDFDADHIFLQIGTPTAGGDKNAEGNLVAISQSAIWKNLKAVKNGHVYTMPQWIISDYPNIKIKSLDLILEALKKSGS